MVHIQVVSYFRTKHRSMHEYELHDVREVLCLLLVFHFVL